jgi:hypothetical protein
MSNIKTQLEVGDKIVQHYYSQITLITIERVTAKRAYSKHIQFKREISEPSQFEKSLSISEIGRDAYSRYSYMLYIPEVYDERLKRQRLENKANELAKKFASVNYSNETLEKLIELLTK